MSCKVRAGQSTGTKGAGLPELNLTDVSVCVGYTVSYVVGILQSYLVTISLDTSGLSEAGICLQR